MAAYSKRVLACLALLATTLSMAHALTEAECKAKEEQDSLRCNAASLSFCERWVCQQNVNRKFRMCLATAGTTNFPAMKAACDAQQREDATRTVCEYPAGTFTDVGIWFNKAWCDREANATNSQTITPTVHAESDALDIIITNRTQQAEALIANATCANGVPNDASLPQCVCLNPVPNSCVTEVRTDVVAKDPERFPVPSFNDTVSQILVSDFNYTQEDADTAANGSTCQRFPDLDECQKPSPAPARRLLQPLTVSA